MKHNTVLFFAYISLFLLLYTIVGYFITLSWIKPINAVIVSYTTDGFYGKNRFKYQLEYIENGELFTYDYLPDHNYVDAKEPPPQYAVGNKVKIYVFRDNMSYYYGHELLDRQVGMFIFGIAFAVLIFIARNSLRCFTDDVFKRYRFMVIFSAIYTALFFIVYVCSAFIENIGYAMLAAIALYYSIPIFLFMWIVSFIKHKIKEERQ